MAIINGLIQCEYYYFYKVKKPILGFLSFAQNIENCELLRVLCEPTYKL